ncbi:MAG TPA: hypothetical protein ENI68_03195 [Gammaproteobacteria bacterium]|nr:hypothetical protein [Gammaproteobacteria bacterium]
MNDERFSYKPNIVVFILSSVVLAGIAVGMAYIAYTNEQGLILNGIIELSIEGATVFHWSLAVACGTLAIFGAVAVVGASTSKREIIVSGNIISAPKSGFSKKIIMINLAEVTDVNIQSVQKQKFLNIIHPSKKLAIPQAMLTSKQLFEKLTELVVSRVNG